MADEILKGDVEFQMLDGTKILTFQPAHQHLQLVNPEGTKRLDYIIMRAPKTFVPIVKTMEILKFKVGGCNMSDHFGLRATFEEATQISF